MKSNLETTSGESPSTRPPRIYKYRRLDEKTISLIVNSVIYFAKPDQFNDPFDCRCRYDLTGSEAEWRDLFKELLTQFHPELSRQQVARMVNAKMKEGDFRNSRFLESVSNDALITKTSGSASFVSQPIRRTS